MIDPTIQARWAAGSHVGAARPSQVVRIQRGLMDRDYQSFRLLDDSAEYFGDIAGETDSRTDTGHPWQAFWRNTGDWIVVPNVSEVHIEYGLDDSAMGSATIVVENVLFAQIAGTAGIYHLIQRGALSPTFGYAAVGRPAYGGPSNAWYDVFNGGYRVEILQGYGDALAPVFAGLIDENDIRATPDQITITCRSFGQMLTDSRVFGSNKANNIRSPITFCDRLRADEPERVSAGAEASSEASGHPATEVEDMDDDYWLSDTHTTPSNTEWVQIRLTDGRYEDFMLDPHYNGMSCYVSVYAHAGGLTEGPKKDGVSISEGWVTAGLGDVPGTAGGVPYVRLIPVVNGSGVGFKHDIGPALELGDNSILRLSFRNLQESDPGTYRAGARIVASYQRPLDPGSGHARKQGWILVDDASDVVKWALMWAGFHEWEVESFGARLKDPHVFHQSEFLVDIVKWVQAQSDYVFFIAPPSAPDVSIGVPIFRHASAQDSGYELEVRDTNTVTGLERRFDKSALAFVIRCRGKQVDNGTALGEDLIQRVQGIYFPPWSGAHGFGGGSYDPTFVGRLSGVRRHVVMTDRLLASTPECEMAAVLIALQEALAAWTATVEIAGLPGLLPDDRVSVLDAATGMNTRLWLTQVSSSFTIGENGAFTMSLGGAELDGSDLVAVLADRASIPL